MPAAQNADPARHAYAKGAVHCLYAHVKLNPQHSVLQLVGEWQLRVDLAATYRACHDYGYGEGVCNHLSVCAASCCAALLR